MQGVGFATQNWNSTPGVDLSLEKIYTPAINIAKRGMSERMRVVLKVFHLSGC